MAVFQYQNSGYRETILCYFMIMICYLVPRFSSPLLSMILPQPPQPPPPLVCRRRRRPSSLQVQSLLIPPPFKDPHPRPPHRFLAESQNYLSRNVLRNFILNPQYIRLHLLKPCLLHQRLQWGLIPNSVQKPPGLPTCNMSGHHVINHHQLPSHAGGSSPTHPIQKEVLPAPMP